MAASLRAVASVMWLMLAAMVSKSRRLIDVSVGLK
jgi:hypothetical protein